MCNVYKIIKKEIIVDFNIISYQYGRFVTDSFMKILEIKFFLLKDNFGF